MPVRLRATKTTGRSCARRRAYLGFAAFAVLVAYQPAEGQESSQLPAFERQQPGVAEEIPNDFLPPSDAPSVDELSAPLIGQALVSLFNDSVPRTRGAPDISLFRNVAPSVVLIWTKDGALGSGSLLKDNTILTNRHVVGGEREVTVVFKSSDPSGRAQNDEVVPADIIKLDGLRDLALLRPASIPSRRPLDISALNAPSYRSLMARLVNGDFLIASQILETSSGVASLQRHKNFVDGKAEKGVYSNNQSLKYIGHRCES
jgi:S1-C subfamily serine protease